MIISLAVLLVPLIALVAFCQPDKSSQVQRPIDPSRTYQAAARLSGFEVREPAGLGSAWRATHASFRTDRDKAPVLRVSYLTPEGDYVQLVQSGAAAPTVIPEELGEGKMRGQTELAGVTWQQYAGRRAGDTAFVLIEPKLTTIVVGEASVERLRTFASALAPVRIIP